MTKKSKFKRLTMHSVLALSLMASAAPMYTYADGVQAEAENVFDIPSIGSVWVNNSSYFEIKNVRLTPGSDSNLVTFAIKIVNGSSSDIQFIDYWIKLQTTAGAKFTVNVIPQDKDKNLIPAGGSQEIQFYASVTPTSKLSDLEFNVIKWDFSATDYQKVLGSLRASDEYSTVAPAGAKANFKIAKTTIQGYIKKATTSSNEENYLPSVLLELQNTDSRSLKLPALKFMLRTADGLTYPLQATGVGDNTTIDPLMKKEIALSGKLPRSIQNEGWQLVITEVTSTGEDSNINAAIVEFALPKSQGDQTSTEKEQSFSNKDGAYVTKLESIQRMPWEDEDIISAMISLKTSENKSMPIPNLVGYIKLDDSVKVDVKVIQTDNVIGLQPGKEVRLQLLGKIPYTYDFSELTIYLQEKEGTTTGTGSSSGSTGGTVTDLVQFKVNSEMDNLPLVNPKEHFKIGGVGRSGDYTIQSVNTFPGKSSDIVTAQVEVENLEKRANELSKLVAHFKGSDGTIYPAAISDIKSKISPSGKALLFISARVASNKSSDITQLILGEGITEGKFTQVDGKPDSYVNAVSFFLPSEQKEALSAVKEINLFPYNLKVNKVATAVDQQKITLKFNYELEKDAQYEVNSEDYKLVVELADADGKATMSWPLNVEKTKDGATDGKDTLRIGKETIELTKNDENFIFKVTYLKKYKLNIYHQYQGEKKLIASQDFDWFIVSD
ncbi:hypothetical protein [Paenibacillus ginsengarvi]|uniref:Uncharacterized protein n=1 Tax=Paenibacillus ginsengarvi TaxID=400777 RepID=A0A3B0C2Z5_9BACL|nr:hypothetical protein [Paenibacillus ginsengarvi]RKN78864.1 hypothetical protein D7M11_22580 [Paenibacillus ginsengarvi]